MLDILALEDIVEHAVEKVMKGEVFDGTVKANCAASQALDPALVGQTGG